MDEERLRNILKNDEVFEQTIRDITQRIELLSEDPRVKEAVILVGDMFVLISQRAGRDMYMESKSDVEKEAFEKLRHAIFAAFYVASLDI